MPRATTTTTTTTPRKKRNQPSRLYSQKEIAAWSRRPHGCTDLKRSIELVHDDLDDMRLRARSRKLAHDCVVRKFKWEATPEWCYTHEHPLRCGIPGKLYMRSDVFGPIVDAMTRMRQGLNTSDAFDVFGDVSKKKKRKMAFVEEASSSERKPSCFGWECSCCGNRDVRLQIQTKDSLVCPCGAVVRMGGEIVSTHREKLGAAEEDDRTQHADAVRVRRTDKYDHAPVGADELRCNHRSASRRAHPEPVPNATREHVELSSRETLKQERILEATEKIFKKLMPVDQVIKRQVRIEVDRLWLDSVVHSKICTASGCCQIRLQDRTASIIASSVFEITVNRIINGEIIVDQLDREHIIDLHVRMQRSPAFSNVSSMTQMSSAKAVISIMQEPDFNACAPCAQTSLGEREVPTRTLARLPLLPIRPPMRMDSSMTLGGDSSPANELIQFRDAITNVYYGHKTTLPTSVRDGALRALQSPSFLSNVTSLECIKGLSHHCVSFCILNAISRAKQRSTVPSFAARVEMMNVPIAQKLQLDLAIAEDAIQAILAIVPTDVALEVERDDDDDDLFA